MDDDPDLHTLEFMLLHVHHVYVCIISPCMHAGCSHKHGWTVEESQNYHLTHC